MKTIIAILAMLQCFRSIADVWLPASGFTLSSPWTFTVDTDSPQGGWQMVAGIGTNSFAADINTGQTLPSGNQALFLKSIDYDWYWPIEFSAGGATATNSTSDRDYNYRWSTGTIISPSSAFSNVVITWTKSPTVAQRTRLLGLYVTPTTNTVMLSTDHHLTLTVPDPAHYDSRSNGLNLIPNGSFEAGFRRGWSLSDTARTLAHDDAWDPSVGWHGAASLRIVLTNAQDIEIIHKPVTCASNRVYVWSFWAKSTGTNGFQAIIRNTFTAPTNFAQTQSTNFSLSVGTNWTRVSVTNRVLAYPYSDVNVSAYVGSTGTTTNWFDGFQLSDYQSTNYVPESPLELGIWTGRRAGIFYSDESVSIPVLLNNSSAGTLNGSVTLRAFDYLNRTVADTAANYTLSHGETNSVYLAMPALQGSFRIVAFDAVNGGQPDEAVISIIPRRRTVDPAVSMFGHHSNFSDWQFQIMTNIGLQWARAMSPGGFFRWSIAEPSAGANAWYDSEVALATNYGIRILGNLTQYPATWATRSFFRLASISGTFSNTEPVASLVATGYVARALVGTNFTGAALYLSNRVGTFSATDSITGLVSGATATITNTVYNSAAGLDRWAAHVSNVVAHYSGSVTNWEIANEPNLDITYMAGGDSGVYSEFLREAVNAISAIQPTAQIVGLGGNLLTNWSATVLSNMPPDVLTNIDTVSFHWYPGNEAQVEGTVSEFDSLFGKPSLNTESGVWDLGSYTHWNSNIPREGTPVDYYRDADRFYRGLDFEAARLMRNHIETLGDGSARVFTYDMRFGDSDTDRYDTQLTGIEHDDGLKPRMVALAVLINQIDGAASLGRCTTNTGLRGFTWNLGTNAVVTLHSRSWTNIWTCTLPGSFPSYFRLDMMGNRVGTNEASFVFGGQPVYLEVPHAPSSVHTNMLAATFSAAADSLAPSPTVTIWPTIPAGASDQRIPIRWFAIDTRDHPEAGSEEALLYSVRLSPTESNPGEWSAETQRDIAGYPAGQYTIHVTAKDSSGNSNTVSQSFWIGEIPVAPSATASAVNVGTLIIAP